MRDTARSGPLRYLVSLALVLLVRAEFRAFVQLKAAFLEADYLTWGENDADSAEPPLAVTLQRERTSGRAAHTFPAGIPHGVE